MNLIMESANCIASNLNIVQLLCAQSKGQCSQVGLCPEPGQGHERHSPAVERNGRLLASQSLFWSVTA